MVLDRILLWLFTIACVVGKQSIQAQKILRGPRTCLNSLLFLGTTLIIMAAPSHYDARRPIDVQYSRVDKKNTFKMNMDTF